MVVALAACAGDSAGTGTEWAGTVVDSAGVRIVQNPQEGMWTDETRWGLEEVVSVGGLTGDPNTEFGQISSTDVDDAGNLYVSDVQAAEIRVFDPSGEYLRTIGRPGSGPGEIGPGGLAGIFVIGEELLAVDMANARISRFTLDGEPLEGQVLDVAAGVPIRWDRVGDRVLAQRRAVNAAQAADFEPTGDVIVTMNTEVPDTLHTLPIGQSMQFTGGVPRMKVFEPEPTWDAGEGGRLIAGMNASVRIEVLNDAGALQHVIHLPHEQKQVTERDQRVFEGFMLEAITAQGAPPAFAQQMIDQMEFAEFYPAFATMAVGPAGSVWVQQVRSGDEIMGDDEEGAEFNPQDIGSPRWNVFDAEGRYLGEIEFPGKFQPLRVDGDLVYGIHRDELDVQSARAYRVITGGTDE